MNITKAKVVGLTGGLGSGKSVVRRMLEDLKIPCIDVDTVVRAIHQNATHPATTEIARVFPYAINEDACLSRGSLRTVFALDRKANKHLQAILKPYVLAQMLKWTAQQSSAYVVWESALIIEVCIPVDRVLMISANLTLQVDRVKEKNPDWSETQICRVLALQLGQKKRKIQADDVISNVGTLKNLQQQVEMQHRQYLTLWT